MALTTFTSGQVLTAAQLNAVQANDYNQTVSTKSASYTLVAADKGTRVVMNVATANTVTVNTSLFSAGDTLVIQNIGAGVTTVTAGTATVSSAGPLTISQYGSGTLYFTSAGVSIFFPSAGPTVSSGLTYVGGGALSSTTTTFSNVFSATYNAYRIYCFGFIGNTGSPIFQLQLGSTTANYTYAQMFVGTNATWANKGAGPTSSFCIGQNDSTDIKNAVIDLISPFLSTRTSYFALASGSNNTDMTVGRQDDNTSFTSFSITTDTGATQTGTVKIYGFSNS